MSIIDHFLNMKKTKYRVYSDPYSTDDSISYERQIDKWLKENVKNMWTGTYTATCDAGTSVYEIYFENKNDALRFVDQFDGYLQENMGS